MPTCPLPDLDLYYEHLGDGPPLLVFTGSGSSITAAAPILDTLSSDFRVLVHDQRGLGQTGLPHHDRPATMADYAADAAALLDHVGWDRCAVFGISFGGMVAQEFAVTWPERVSRLALLCTSSGGGGGSSYPLHQLADLDAEQRLAIARSISDTRFTDAWLDEHPRDRMIVSVMEANAAIDKTAEQRRGEALQLEARRGHDVWDRLHHITAPTLIAAGQFDGIAPPANSEAIHSRITGSELRLYDGGHPFLYQDRTAFPEIMQFLTTP